MKIQGWDAGAILFLTLIIFSVRLLSRRRAVPLAHLYSWITTRTQKPQERKIFRHTQNEWVCSNYKTISLGREENTNFGGWLGVVAPLKGSYIIIWPHTEYWVIRARTHSIQTLCSKTDLIRCWEVISRLRVVRIIAQAKLFIIIHMRWYVILSASRPQRTSNLAVSCWVSLGVDGL